MDGGARHAGYREGRLIVNPREATAAISRVRAAQSAKRRGSYSESSPG